LSKEAIILRRSSGLLRNTINETGAAPAIPDDLASPPSWAGLDRRQGFQYRLGPTGEEDTALGPPSAQTQGQLYPQAPTGDTWFSLPRDPENGLRPFVQATKPTPRQAVRVTGYRNSGAFLSASGKSRARRPLTFAA